MIYHQSCKWCWQWYFHQWQPQKKKCSVASLLGSPETSTTFRLAFPLSCHCVIPSLVPHEEVNHLVFNWAALQWGNFPHHSSLALSSLASLPLWPSQRITDWGCKHRCFGSNIGVLTEAPFGLTSLSPGLPIHNVQLIITPIWQMGCGGQIR
jgi:hypothetical protein